MAWKGTKTWGVGPWTFSDANAYLRDNLISLRQYQFYGTGIGYVSEKTGTVTTAGYTVNHFNLLDVADEACRLTVIHVGQFYTPVGGATTVNLLTYGQDGILKSGVPYAISQIDFGVVDGFLIPAGTNPGYSVRIATDVGSCSYYFSTIYLVTPQV